MDLFKNVFLQQRHFFSYNVFSVNSLECFSMNIQEWEIRPQIINLNTNEPLFFPYSINVVMQSMIHMLKHVFKKNNTNVKVFNLMSRTNETRHIK